jgi:hypothetical protein
MAARTGGRAVVTLTALAVLVPAVDVLSLVEASAAGTAGAATGTWGAVATTATAEPWPTGPLTLTVRRNSPAYFLIANTGTLPLVTATYGVTASTPTVLEQCSVAWNERNGRCDGVASEVPTGVPMAAVPVTPGEVLHLRATNNTNQAVTTTVSVVVPRGGVRSPGVVSG